MVASVRVGVHHDGLAVVERGGTEDAPARVAADGPGRVADEDVDLTGLEGRTALVGGQGAELHGLGVAENGGRDGAAEVGVEADGVAALVEEAEARQAAVDAADELAAVLHGGQSAFTGRRVGRIGALGRGRLRSIGSGARAWCSGGWGRGVAAGRHDQGEDHEADDGQSESGHVVKPPCQSDLREIAGPDGPLTIVRAPRKLRGDLSDC